MQVIRGLHNLRDEHHGCVATIGNFDGVHRGHQAILDQLLERARSLSLPATVVVFEPQPREFFAGDQAPPRLTRLRDKVRLLAEYGADRVLCLPFNDALRSLTARAFIEQVLVQGLGVRHLVVGDDFRFGCDRRGDFELLQTVGTGSGFEVEHTRTFLLDGERVSSTRVRTMLASGNFDQAARMLGRPYRLGGRVMRDRQLGRTIGVPTANLPQPPHPLALQGVYAVKAELPGGRHAEGVANIGWRPTVGSQRPVLEVHLFDFDEDLYGERLTVLPCAKLRGEMKFDGLEALKAQIGADQARARRFFAETAATGDSLPLASAPLAREAVFSDSSAGLPADHDDG
ncbi:bifunctional riboflavin kinase/FAD synthetase [Halomonas elongata]|uniref:Riboflavin biosynthesis protein n=1 Tax=Halomonas elongata TaxID=2746 RepID=A0A1B8P719_HALEL|nr:bifunctional riboflavin kinase/FAD synthetase [Halomonas elongata]MDL4863224.1 bifunctional riboflavin kinase/FAD synthetase [Halomonas elongata]OBX38085.1 riboflavin biosynthesis protein RibF [Halomonas elongata]WVI71957.1 bifunctional riboflavin kinase/FAD synthetase [Halomonas elongata]